VTTKINALCDALGNPIRIIIDEGKAHDMRQAPDLVEGLCSTELIADKGYDSDALAAQLEAQGCGVVIPARRGRKSPRIHDPDKYKHRFLVEIFFQRIKRNRRVATRYEKLAVTFSGMIHLAAILVWLR